MTKTAAGQKTPAHDLQAIHRAAASGDVSWQDSVNDDLSKFEYSVDEVLDCLQSLSVESHFRKSVDYQDGKGPFDVYVLRWRHYIESQGSYIYENLYIKIKLTKSGRAAFMLSFHPEGF